MLTDCTAVLAKNYTIYSCPFCGKPGRVLRKSNGDYFGVCSNTNKCPGYNVRTRGHRNPVDAVFAWNVRSGGC